MGAMQYCIAYYSVLAHVHVKRPLLRGGVLHSVIAGNEVLQLGPSLLGGLAAVTSLFR